MGRDERMLAAAAAVILCLPCTGLGYFWDDYYFLTFKGTGDPLVYLLPDPSASFYRPIPQSLYFLALLALDPVSGILGHLVNLAALVLSVILLTSLVSKLAGRQAGLVAGIYFAALGSVPSLVAWISCCQDLFALAFILAAFTLRNARRNGWALAASAGALLCKEPALAFFPALILWDWFTGTRPYRVVRHALAYGALALAWAAIHPGIHTLIFRGFQSGATGYIGFEHPERWARYGFQYLLTILNMPVTGIRTPWLPDRVVVGIAALVLVWCGMRVLGRKAGRKAPPDGHRLTRAPALVVLLIVPPLILPSLLVRLWAPYYSCLAGVGMALGIGVLLRRASLRVVAIALAVSVGLGIWCRGMFIPGEPIWTEPAFIEASRAARKVEANFKALHETLPRGTQVLVSVTSTGIRGIRATLHEAQVLRLWYRDPSLLTLPPELRQPERPAEYLFRVTGALDVVEIDPDRMRVQWTGSGTPLQWEISRPLRWYARALAVSGETDRAVRILRRLGEAERGEERFYDQRLEAMVLLGAGREHDARDILVATPPFRRETALEIVKKILSEPTRSARSDSLAFPAFGLSADDPETTRYLMRRFNEEGLLPQAVDFALRLRRLRPGDAEAEALLRKHPASV